MTTFTTPPRKAAFSTSYLRRVRADQRLEPREIRTGLALAAMPGLTYYAESAVGELRVEFLKRILETDDETIMRSVAELSRTGHLEMGGLNGRGEMRVTLLPAEFDNRKLTASD